MYIIKDRKTNKELVLCRTEIALEGALQTYDSIGKNVYVEYTDRVKLIDPMEQ
jgi:hypothetical protein